MKLSEQLKIDHECGDFGKALDGYAERAELLERDAERYRWLRKQPMYPMWKVIAAAHGEEQRDAVIDDWMKTPNGGGNAP